MFTFLLILILLVSLFITVVVLAQSSKGDGLSGALGAPGSVGAVFGVRRASDFLQKTTLGLGAAFIVLCLIANIFFLPGSASTPSAVSQGKAVVPPTAPMPSSSAPAVQQPAGAQPGTGQTNPDNSPTPAR